MSEKKKHEPKLTNTERHERFVETAKAVEASEDIMDFERAFDKVVYVKMQRSLSKKTNQSSS
ncbi:hypothetical protein [Rhodoblastus sp.]|uniref:hypothetical protein n=1 Tax=Rhodoblastus sp. TaxID=1962975 RepID=UPI003F95E71E